MTQHAALPVLTLTLSILASWSLIMRASLSETLHEDYMTTARAVGLSPRRAVLRHAVPNALLPVIALTAMSLGYVVGGVIFIESVFSWPGIGRSPTTRCSTATCPCCRASSCSPRPP